MTRNELLDMYFMDARAKVLDVAAFLDRVQRGSGEADFRLTALHRAMAELTRETPDRAKAVLISLSDHSPAPLEKSPGKGAIGAVA